MPPQLQQINVTYVDVQDRLLLKVSTSKAEEYRIWCTRRFTRLLLERLEESFEKEMFRPESAASGAVPGRARREMAQVRHGQAVEEEFFQQPYRAEPTAFPLGEEGLLATTLGYKVLPDNSMQMRLGDKSGTGMTLNLDERLKHQTYELFSRAAERAQWFEPRTPAPASVVH